MTTVRIYQPAQTATQSGKAKIKNWVVEFETQNALQIDPLMGWVSSIDTQNQIHLFFPSLEKAIDFAKEKKLTYHVFNPTQVNDPPKNYATNFTCSRMRGS